MRHSTNCTNSPLTLIKTLLLMTEPGGMGSITVQKMEMCVCWLKGKVLNWVQERLFKDVNIFL